MVIKIFILLGIIFILYNYFSFNPEDQVENLEINIKEDKKVKKKKKVKFNLKKNKTYEIPNREDLKQYGEKIIENSYSLQKKILPKMSNPQQELIKRLNNSDASSLKEDMFKNQRGYWESQTIDDFVERDYSNKQVERINELKNNRDPTTGVLISDVFDKLTNARNNEIITPLNDDKNVFKNMDDKIYGYDQLCNYERI